MTPPLNPFDIALERAGRAIADRDQEDYMEDCVIYDQRAKVAIVAFLRALPYTRDPNEAQPPGMFSVRRDQWGVVHYWNAPTLADAIERVCK